MQNTSSNSLKYSYNDTSKPIDSHMVISHHGGHSHVIPHGDHSHVVQHQHESHSHVIPHKDHVHVITHGSPHLHTHGGEHSHLLSHNDHLRAVRHSHRDDHPHMHSSYIHRSSSRNREHSRKKSPTPK